MAQRVARGAARPRLHGAAWLGPCCREMGLVGPCGRRAFHGLLGVRFPPSARRVALRRAARCCWPNTSWTDGKVLQAPDLALSPSRAMVGFSLWVTNGRNTVISFAGDSVRSNGV